MEKKKTYPEMPKPKPKCTCGKDMQKVSFKGYYDEHEFWWCVDDNCTEIEKFPTDLQIKGAYV